MVIVRAYDHGRAAVPGQFTNDIGRCRAGGRLFVEKISIASGVSEHVSDSCGALRVNGRHVFYSVQNNGSFHRCEFELLRRRDTACDEQTNYEHCCAYGLLL